MHDKTGNDAAMNIDVRDLLAWADGRLDPDSARAADVRAHLAAHPEDAARVADWQAQDAAIRAHYAPVMAEAVPAQLLSTVRRDAALRQRGRAWTGLAVAASMMVPPTAGVVVGMTLSGGDAELEYFAARVAEYSADDATRDTTGQVVGDAATPAVTGGVATVGATGAHVSNDNAALPDLSIAGFSLRSQQRLPEAQNRPPVTEALYEDQRGHTLRLFMTSEPKSQSNIHNRLAENGRDVVYWRSGGRMYALAADEYGAQRLQELAAAALRGADHGTAIASNDAEIVEDPPVASTSGLLSTPDASAPEAVSETDRRLQRVPMPVPQNVNNDEAL